MKNEFDEFITYRALALKYSGTNNLGFMPEEILDIHQFRNVCAKLHPELVDRLDETTGLLGMTKRDFIELALIDALDRATKILECDVDALSRHTIKETSQNE